MKQSFIALFALVTSATFAQTNGEMQAFYNSFSLPDTVFQKAGTDSVFERKNGLIFFRFIIASGITQATLNDSTNAIRTTVNNKLSANGDGSALTGLTKTQVGLSNVDNTSDANKPVSTATQTALNGKQDILISGTNIKTINGAAILGSGDLVISGVATFINLTSAFSSTSVTLASVTGWSFSVTTGKTYRIEVIADYQTAATTTGGTIGIALTTAAGTVRGYAKGAISQSAVATELVIPIRTTTGAGSSLTTTGVSVINSPHYISMLITFTCTTSGTFAIQWASEVAASAAQLNANSSLIYQVLN